jgi:glycogen operon protein
MIRAGDELSHSQGGNNNAYCQDNEISWLNWELNDRKKDFLDFINRVIHLWRENPVLKRRRFFQGRPIRGGEVKDISWFQPSGGEMTDKAWNEPFARCLGVRLAGDAIDEVDSRGERIVGDTLMLLFNAHHESIPFRVPAVQPGEIWEPVLDTANPYGAKTALRGGHRYELQGRSMAVLRMGRRMKP